MSPEPYQRFINYTTAAATAAPAVAVAAAAETSDSSRGVPARAQRTIEALTKLRMRQVSAYAVMCHTLQLVMLCSTAIVYNPQEYDAVNKQERCSASSEC
jgi:hypothetical protein